jgi:hypothetical protein
MVDQKGDLSHIQPYGRAGLCTETRAFRQGAVPFVAGCVEAPMSGGDVQLAAEADRPRVFLSFAGSDRETAKRLGQDLVRAGIKTFVDEQDITPGGVFPLAINRALTQSDYYVLLWSQASVDRPWVEAEWSAALTRDLTERRSFLFVVRLDKTPVPLLLAARRYLDAFEDWDGVVDELLSTWRRDWAVRRNGSYVLPAPHWAAVQRPSIVLYIRNRDLSVEHVLAVPEQSTGEELERQVHTGLALKGSVTQFGGTVGMRFFYKLKHAKQPIPRDKTLVELGITHGATIELEVQMQQFGPNGSSPIETYRYRDATRLPPATTRLLINAAFGHLRPW